MIRVISSLLIGCAASMASAEEKLLSSADIETLFQGATIKGLHYGVETRQYFSTSGLTLWIKEGDATPSEARYKIEDDQYCSSWTGLWAEEEYGCFSVAQDADQGLYYFLSDGFRAPFVLNDGFDLSFD
ncbi:hypothetical protein [Ruegeria sp. A3M17]|uniref:hypothetical protein n=1 Tax=Ruegeria sp. A3M17 TaxID=2267229 RepID=UPI000DE92747|nr:hypothetical protein [Ruegeria sp. A3M17]RBW53700.1 hypothetical protein DS906_17300 [Ruegeria sp. A3M17]